MQITIKTVVRSGSKYIEVWKNGILSEIKRTKHPLKEIVKILRKMKAIEA